MTATRRLAIIADADARHPQHTPEWAYAALDELTDEERTAIDEKWYALPMPRVRFSEVLRRELLTGEECAK